MSTESKKQDKTAFASTKAGRALLSLHHVYLFILRFFREGFLPPVEFREIVRQCYHIGYKSVGLIGLTGFIIGVVFTKQSRAPLLEFGAESWLPSLIGIAVIRALAPLITALISAGKVGSNIAAEIGSMAVSEQIDAMEVSGIKPFKFLVGTRIISTTIMVPVLMIYNAFIALAGAYVNIKANENTSLEVFIQNTFDRIVFLDFYASLIKAVVFGFTIGVTASYKGYYTTQGTKGVGRAANAAVVVSMFLIFIEEMIIVQIVNALRPM